MKKEISGAKVLKTSKVKKQKNYFEIIFVSVSIVLFLFLVFSIYFLKNALYTAKDEAAKEFTADYKDNKISESLDPFVLGKGEPASDLSQPIDDGQDPSLGSEQAKIKIFYFSDLACPFCYEQEEVIKKVYDKFNQDVRIIWKDYPDLKTINDFSYQAARAVRCANDQGKFWDYRHLLKESQREFNNIKNQLFLNLASSLKLNVSSFESCLKSDKTDKMILRNVEEAENLGVAGIPYIYVNDLDVIGSLSETDLENLVENELAK